MPTVDVLIAGGGPTGLAAASALGGRGANVLLVEQDPGVAELPRAVSVDDEAMRFMQSLGLRAEAEAVVVPGTGTKYFGARGQLLVYARGPERRQYGHPVKNPMDHPEFQRMLLEGARQLDNVEVRHRTRLVDFTQDEDGISAEIEGPDGPQLVRSRYLLGCDGGRSPVRNAIGQEPMSGSTFEERWLVVDTLNDVHDERYAMHHGDPSRPRVVIVGRGGRCRYEFMLREEERPEGDDVLELARRLIAPYRQLTDDDIVRCTVYQFYALVARRWSEGRVFLAGDAAHMMPPFAGQGMNSGLRDAANISWKLAAVLDGQAGPALLDTYEAERKPHVEAIVRLSVRMGKVMMTRSAFTAAVRDAVFAAGTSLPVFRKFFREMRFKPAAHYRAGFVISDGPSDPVAGSMLVQPRVIDAQGRTLDLDDVLGNGFALLGVGTPATVFDGLRSELWQTLAARYIDVSLDDRLPAPGPDGRASVGDADGLLAEQLGHLRGRMLLVRPDRFVVGSFTPADESVFTERLEALLSVPTGGLRSVTAA